MIADLSTLDDNQLTEFINTKLSSKLWRLNNLYTIQDKDANERILKLNTSQHKILTKFRHNKKIILKSRQQGISTLFLAYNLDACIFTPNIATGIQSYGQSEADKLAQRGELMWERLDPTIKELLGIKLTRNNNKGMVFSNRSTLRIGNFRGDTLQRLHVSELGKIAKMYPAKAEELKTGAFQAVSKNNTITIESTAEGKTGLFYEMWKAAEVAALKDNLSPFDFQAIFLSWMEDSDCEMDYKEVITPEMEEYFQSLNTPLKQTQKWWYVAKSRELGDKMKQEYPSTPDEAFEQSVEGTYYRTEFENLKLITDSYDPHLKVHSVCDLGMNDTFAILFFQIHNNRVKIINEYMNSGYGLEHYRDVYTALTNELGYTHGKIYVPHDVRVRELIAGKTRWDALKELGFRPILVNKHKVQDGIEATRQFLKDVEVDEKCERLLAAIQNYRKKYDKTLGVFLDSPLHDDHSNPADALRYLSMGHKYKAIVDNYVREVYNKRSYDRPKQYSGRNYDI